MGGVSYLVLAGDMHKADFRFSMMLMFTIEHLQFLLPFYSFQRHLDHSSTADYVDNLMTYSICTFVPVFIYIFSTLVVRYQGTIADLNRRIRCVLRVVCLSYNDNARRRL